MGRCSSGDVHKRVQEGSVAIELERLHGRRVRLVWFGIGGDGGVLRNRGQGYRAGHAQQGCTEEAISPGHA
jgi:hypothetical protein